LGGVVVAVRMLFALGRDGMLPAALSRVSARTGTPSVALGLGLVLITIFRLAGASPLQMFFTLVTFGVLNLLVMYVVTNLVALRVPHGRGCRFWTR
jgi:amino acid transporter